MTHLTYRPYRDENDIPTISSLIEKDLSEPYSIFTYRLFVSPWPDLCEMCFDEDTLIGVVLCKIDRHKSGTLRAYIGMLAVEKAFRHRGIAMKLVETVMERIRGHGADEVVLEAEVTNEAALAFYDKLGFIRTKRLSIYYLSGKDAYRLKKFIK